MSDKKIIYRLELAVEKIDQVFEICKPKGVTAALEDELLAKPFEAGVELSAKQDVMRHKITALYSKQIDSLFVD